jgi:serine/threonine protein kinase
MSDAIQSDLPRIAGYEITQRLGRGGMADVYLGTQLSLSRPVAIKVLSGERTRSETVTRFEHEARTIARLDHPYIVSIFDVGRTADGRLYYTMPYLPRGDLAARDLHGNEAEIATIVRALCRALAYAHELGIVHRDVKPENVLFDHLDRPLLADFGIALTTHETMRVTREGSTIGSSGYMSPEQARGFAIDGRADLYSLGVVTYEMLSGDLPFHGPDTLSMALAHVEQPIPRLPLEHRRWQSFIDKAMAKDSAERFQSAAQMEAALDVIEADLRNASSRGRGLAAPRHGMRPQFGLIAACILLAIGAVMLASTILRIRDTSPQPSPDDSISSAPVAASLLPGEPASKPVGAATLVPAPAAPEAPAIPAQNDAAKSASADPDEVPQLSPGSVLRDAQGPDLAFVSAKHEGAMRGFALARHEVTVGDYAVFARATGRAASRCLEPKQPLSRMKKLSWREPAFTQGDKYPVVCVSWNDAVAYAQWLSQRMHAPYRLPTRAQWLDAARATSAHVAVCAQGNLAHHGVLPFHLGAGNDCKSRFEHTAPIGQFRPNALGIYDMVGNVSEWVLDCKPLSTGAGGHCGEHLFNGTSWRDNADANNLEAVGDADADLGYTTVGIRLLRKLDADNIPPQVH